MTRCPDGHASAARAGSTSIGAGISIRPICRRPSGSNTTPHDSTRSRSTTASIACPSAPPSPRGPAAPGAPPSAWGAPRAPMAFEIAVKASRFLTHMKKLKDPEEPVDRLFSRMRALGTHLGPVLYQLPPGWKVDVERFRHFLQTLPKGTRHVVEFREPSWYAAEIRALMERYRVALCLHDM